MESNILFFSGVTNKAVSIGKNNKEVTRRVVVSGIVEGNTIKLGKAECSEKDTFTKAKGRLIASGRAAKKPFATINVVEGESAGKTFANYVKASL